MRRVRRVRRVQRVQQQPHAAQRPRHQRNQHHACVAWSPCLPRFVLGREQIKLFFLLYQGVLFYFGGRWKHLEIKSALFRIVVRACGQKEPELREFCSRVRNSYLKRRPLQPQSSWSAAGVWAGGAGRFLHRSFLEDLPDLWEITSEPSRCCSRAPSCSSRCS